ncbi:flagellar FliJ family protein [bacterium AH-315-B06]|nr:flagellar FliJ family protein [bacterium AH-315-B06]
MKGLDALIKIHGFELDQKRRALKEIEEAEAGIETKIRNLEAELLDEQEAARHSVEGVYTYGGYARAVITRRETLRQSQAEVMQQLAAARNAVAEAFETLKKYEITKASRDARARAEATRRETIQLDELGLNAHTRAKAGSRN